MHLNLGDHYFISEILPSDKRAYLKHLVDKEIYNTTLNIPHPYKPEDADWWIEHNLELAAQNQGAHINWAIRRREDSFLIGGIGFHDFKVNVDHRAEIGYWIAKPFWGQGIATHAVKAIAEFAFESLGLARITANVFHFNLRSSRVLEKSGFQYEGLLRSHYKKAGNIFDGKLYARIASDSIAAEPAKQAPFRRPRPEFIKNYLEIQDLDNAHYPNSNELLSIGSPLGKRLGLTRIGIHHDVLPPGRRTSWPHAESEEEEFVFVIEGYPDVWIDGELIPLGPGDAVAFPAGTGICHTFLNNSSYNVRLMTIGESKKTTNKCYYPLHLERNAQAKSEGWLWENPPPRKFGPHNGLPKIVKQK